ncbi:uncharacterized protein EMH_0093880 [Eimeria mitis]|uniref:Uncharacterized protein n=1 Tax=Eimeria mitis TaxID=44415 RepID=U6KFC2_9EIME|nr:uncharacterized protein EMH_0093880 [Eimeria mitis]CDJ34927.1 hypothetical protein EMH_0093880 [Eimeria mitis]
MFIVLVSLREKAGICTTLAFDAAELKAAREAAAKNRDKYIGISSSSSSVLPRSSSSSNSSSSSSSNSSSSSSSSGGGRAHGVAGGLGSNVRPSPTLQRNSVLLLLLMLLLLMVLLLMVVVVMVLVLMMVLLMLVLLVLLLLMQQSGIRGAPISLNKGEGRGPHHQGGPLF